ncbi:MAG: glycoside hydrolase family 95 protein [bacterium]|jgi:alpha-L-fucosidase 2|nr:glycoside hydrolase family 95 protein [bacterium]
MIPMLVPAILILTSLLPLSGWGEENPLCLWYEKPASEWVEALPIGNGSLGAMVFGGVETERIQFNQDTLWTGVPRDYLNPAALNTLPRVRQLLFEGKQQEAEEVAMGMMSIPLRQEAYQPFGDLTLRFEGHPGYTNYKRSLDLPHALATTVYTVNGVTYTREILASYPDQILAMRIQASEPGAIHTHIGLSSPHAGITEERVLLSQHALLRFGGQLQPYFNPRTKETKPSALRFEAQLRIEATGGRLIASGTNQVEIQGADSLTLKLAAATSYKNFRDIGANPAERCELALNGVKSKDFAAIQAAHEADYRPLFDRVTIDLGRTGAATQPTDVRIQQFGQQPDPALAALYFQYARYLLLASSRPGSQPANLQGIWNQELQPPWDSKWTVNINTEMNYWPAEMTQLSECAEPLFAMLDDLAITGGAVARYNYNCRGWVLHHNTDLWRGAAPINATNHGIWPTGGAWLCQHLWERYAFTQDLAFLRERAYPLMKGAALFFLDFLVHDHQTGWLISTPSNSPENGGLVAGPTMDHQIIRNLFSTCIAASEILGLDEDLRQEWIAVRAEIAPNQIGQHGQLQEWLKDQDNPKNNHRHVSHLWGLHPGNEISPIKRPDLAAACKVTLAHRGDGGTGWSKAWKVNFWARLLDGNHAYKMFAELLGKSTLPNLFDTHPPFQIDGNFGGCSGLAEMLLQSHAGELHLLPALPDTLAQGEVRGLAARGGFVVDLDWKQGGLRESRITSLAGQPLVLRYGERLIAIPTQKGKTYTFNPQLFYRVN